ncbi:MAG: tyrosine-type recombinase/integrase [Desulfobulbaceae bacterium]
MKINLKSIESTAQVTNRRKAGINRNREGSVRNINGQVYVDFFYLNERVRESSGLPWNKENEKLVRMQLDEIIIAIRNNSFRYASVFPASKKSKKISQKEGVIYGRRALPQEVNIRDYAKQWYQLYKDTNRVTERTLLSYKSFLNLYIVPYFGDFTFADINAVLIERFVSWAKKRRFRSKTISDKSINKTLIPLKMICKSAAIEFNWGRSFDPFFGFKKLSESDNSRIAPFKINEQKQIIECLPNHWKPYFLFAFSSGLRVGEQIALKPDDVDWEKRVINIRRAMTLDEHGKPTIGNTKNKYSRRTIWLIPVMLDAIKKQAEISNRLGSEYLFCTPSGHQVQVDNLRGRVWSEALKKAGLDYRPLRQTRHTFATTALSLGENPLWIAKVMGHRDTEMVIKVYASYLQNNLSTKDGASLNGAYQKMMRNDGEL